MRKIRSDAWATSKVLALLRERPEGLEPTYDGIAAELGLKHDTVRQSLKRLHRRKLVYVYKYVRIVGRTSPQVPHWTYGNHANARPEPVDRMAAKREHYRRYSQSAKRKMMERSRRFGLSVWDQLRIR